MMKHGLKGLAIGSTLFAILLLSGCDKSSPTATSATATCGNAALETGEDCDSPNIGGKSCRILESRVAHSHVLQTARSTQAPVNSGEYAVAESFLGSVKYRARFAPEARQLEVKMDEIKDPRCNCTGS